MLIMSIMLNPYSRKNASGRGNVNNVNNVNSYLGLLGKSGSGFNIINIINIINISPLRSIFCFPQGEMLIMSIMLNPDARKNASGRGNVNNVNNVNSYLGLLGKSGSGFNIIHIINISPARSIFCFPQGKC